MATLQDPPKKKKKPLPAVVVPRPKLDSNTAEMVGGMPPMLPRTTVSYPNNPGPHPLPDRPPRITAPNRAGLVAGAQAAGHAGPPAVTGQANAMKTARTATTQRDLAHPPATRMTYREAQEKARAADAALTEQVQANNANTAQLQAKADQRIAAQRQGTADVRTQTQNAKTQAEGLATTVVPGQEHLHGPGPKDYSQYLRGVYEKKAAEQAALLDTGGERMDPRDAQAALNAAEAQDDARYGIAGAHYPTDPGSAAPNQEQVGRENHRLRSAAQGDRMIGPHTANQWDNIRHQQSQQATLEGREQQREALANRTQRFEDERERSAQEREDRRQYKMARKNPESYREYLKSKALSQQDKDREYQAQDRRDQFEHERELARMQYEFQAQEFQRQQQIEQAQQREAQEQQRRDQMQAEIGMRMKNIANLQASYGDARGDSKDMILKQIAAEQERINGLMSRFGGGGSTTAPVMGSPTAAATTVPANGQVQAPVPGASPDAASPSNGGSPWWDIGNAYGQPDSSQNPAQASQPQVQAYAPPAGSKSFKVKSTGQTLHKLPSGQYVDEQGNPVEVR